MRLCVPGERENPGANDGSRTHDIQDHNLALYQLSYVRHRVAGSYAERAAGVNSPPASRARASQAPSRSTASRNTSSFLQKAKRA